MTTISVHPDHGAWTVRAPGLRQPRGGWLESPEHTVVIGRFASLDQARGRAWALAMRMQAALVHCDAAGTVTRRILFPDLSCATGEPPSTRRALSRPILTEASSPA